MGTKIYSNQPLNVPMTFTDQDDAIINITAGTVTLDLFGPENQTETPTTTISWSIVSGVDGTATVYIPDDTLTAGQWRLQPVVTLSAIDWPGTVTAIIVTPRGKV